MIYSFFNIISLCIALAATETIHGIFRATILVPRIGKKNALKLSIVTGSILAFFICYFFVPKIGITNNLHLFFVGLIASMFMASFDIALSKIVLKRSFSKTLCDFNPKTGNYLIFGLSLLIIYPIIVMAIRG